MSTCTTFSCYLMSLKESAELKAEIDIEGNDDMTSIALAEKIRQTENEFDNFETKTSNFRIIFPVVLVISILVVIGIGLLLHHLISSVVSNNFTLPGESSCTRGRFRRRRRNHVRTVSSYVDVPPTYRQVMKSKKSEMQPPTYKDVMTGAVNCGFVADEDIVATLGRYHINEDDSVDDKNKRRNTNSFTYSRSIPKSENDAFNILVHTADIFSISVQNASTLQQNVPQNHVTVEIVDSVEIQESTDTTITIADVEVAISSEDETNSENGNVETTCSAV